MNLGDRWSEIESDSEEIHRMWEHQESENQVKVSEYEDGTWDAFLNDRLIENYDEREEAVSKAEDIAENRVQD